MLVRSGKKNWIDNLFTKKMSVYSFHIGLIWMLLGLVEEHFSKRLNCFVQYWGDPTEDTCTQQLCRKINWEGRTQPEENWAGHGDQDHNLSVRLVFFKSFYWHDFFSLCRTFIEVPLSIPCIPPTPPPPLCCPVSRTWLCTTQSGPSQWGAPLRRAQEPRRRWWRRSGNPMKVTWLLWT